MARILEERGYKDTGKTKAQCGKKFTDCHEGSATCCRHQMLYNKPDLKIVNSNLEADMKACGFKILFLPKFHCELNVIKQRWVMQSGIMNISHSLQEDVFEQNIVQALDEVSSISMRRCIDIDLIQDNHFI